MISAFFVSLLMACVMDWLCQLTLIFHLSFLQNSFGAAALSSAISLSVLLGATVPDVATLSSGPAGGAPPTSANNVGGTATTTTERVVPSATSSSASSVTESRPASSILMGARAKQEERRAAQDAAQAKRDAKRTEIEANMREQSKASTVDATTAGSSSGMNSLMNKIEDSSAATQTPTSPQEGPATVTEETVSPPTSGTTSAMESLLSQATTTIEEESKELAESEQSIPSAPTTMATTTAPSVTTNDDSVAPPPPKAPPVSFMDTLMSKIDENMASKTQVPPPPKTLPPTMEKSASKNTVAARIQDRMHQQKPETSTAAAQSNIMDTLKEEAVPFAIGAASLSVFAALGAAGDDELDTAKPSEKYEKESFTPYANATTSTRFTAAQPKSHFIPNTTKGNQQQPAQSYSPYGASKNWPKKSSPTGLQSSNNGLSPNQPAAKNYSPFGQSTPSSNTGSSNQQFSQPLERNTFSPYGNKDWKKTPSDPKTLFAPSGTWKAPEGEEPKSWPTSTPGDEKSVVEVKTPNGTVQVTLPKGAAPIKGSTPVSGFPSPSTNTFQPISEPVKASAPTPDSTAYGRSMPPPPVQKSSVSSNPKPAAPTSGSYLDRISQAVVLSNNPSDAASTGQMMQPAKPSFGTVSYMEAARPRETSQEDYMPSMDDLEKQRDEYMDLN